MQAIPTQHLLLKPAETAALLRVDRRTVHRWGKEGRLGVVELSPFTRRYTVASVAALIEASGDGAGADHPVPAARNGEQQPIPTNGGPHHAG